MDQISGIVINSFLMDHWDKFEKHCDDQKQITGRDSEEIYSEFSRYLPFSLDLETYLESEE